MALNIVDVRIEPHKADMRCHPNGADNVTNSGDFMENVAELTLKFTIIVA